MIVLDRDWRLLLDGKNVPAAQGARYPTYSPSTGELLAEVPAATAEDVDAAVRAAQVGQPEWAACPARDRATTLRAMAGVLRANREELAALDAHDSGNPVAAMTKDVDHAAQMLELFADWGDQLAGQTFLSDPDHLHYSIREPFGVVARIIPYNHPIMFAASKLAAPLLAGNAVLLKAPDQTPLSALRMGELFADLLPPGTLSVLSGSGSVVGEALTSHPVIRRIAFTGSVRTGQAVLQNAARSGIKTVTLELGGKNPMVVLADADVEAAAAGAVTGMNFSATAGQSCGSTSRLLVHRSLMADLVGRLEEHVRALRVGDPLDPQTQMGTLVTRDHLDMVSGYVRRGIDEGLRMFTGGQQIDERGAYAVPTVFVDVPPDSPLSRDEIFGPVLVVTPFDDEQEALRLVNDTEFGLTASFWTQDVGRAHRLAASANAGYVWINTASKHFLGMPFGGVKDSGVGREESVEELHSFTQTKAVSVRL
jgi:2-formylbenzoate dehydrogenase